MVDKGRSVLAAAEEVALLVESVEDYAMFFLEPSGGIRSGIVGRRGSSVIPTRK